MQFEELKDKKVLILGYGREGQDTFLVLRKLFPNKVIGIADEKEIKTPDKKTKAYSGKNYLTRIGEWGVIIKTPGIAFSKIKKYLKKDTIVTSQTELFFDNFKGKIVGVTGTKGKGTVASLIYHILKKAGRAGRRAGKKVELVGNIGKPALGVWLKGEQEIKNLPAFVKASADKIFVYELSSHQLQNLRKSPQIAVFTNLFSDHLDYYQNLQEYQQAKQNIAKFQSKNDIFIFNAKSPKLAQIAKTTKAIKRPILGQNKRFQSHLEGDFNQLNIALAREAVRALGVTDKEARQAIKTFKPLPHRLEFVGDFKGVKCYNDSMSTIPETAIAAIKALGRQVETLIVGGSDKGSDYRQLSRQISQSKIKNLIILGEGTGQKIKVENKIKAGSMKQAVKIALTKTSPGKICLLSPGSASFNLFKSYQDRGEQFIKWLKYYGKAKSKQ